MTEMSLLSSSITLRILASLSGFTVLLGTHMLFRYFWRRSLCNKMDETCPRLVSLKLCSRVPMVTSGVIISNSFISSGSSCSENNFLMWKSCNLDLLRGFLNLRLEPTGSSSSFIHCNFMLAKLFEFLCAAFVLFSWKLANFDLVVITNGLREPGL